jgi:hypothetical protein
MRGGRKTYKTRTCPHCHTDIKARGYVSHERSCRSKRTKQREDAAFHKSQHSVTEGTPLGKK